MLKALVRARLGVAYLTALGVERDIAERKLAWMPLECFEIQATRSISFSPGDTAFETVSDQITDALKVAN
jgi:hypothetical protein